jgi:hypothetical protein
VENCKKLSLWALKYGIAGTAIDALLKLLREIGVKVSSETLLRTPRNVPVQKKSGGDYVYLGIEAGLQKVLVDQSLDVVELMVNIDGLPIFNSKQSSAWLTQCDIANMRKVAPFVAGFVVSDKKPNNTDYLIDFATELGQLLENGVQLNEHHKASLKVHSIICDSPAKCHVKGTVQFNGFKGCDYCDIQGVHLQHRMLFLNVGTPEI